VNDWRALFEPATDATGEARTVRVVRKHGHDLLVLPADRAAAARSMALYPAQTTLAKGAKALLRTALASGLPVPLPTVQLSVARSDALSGWLQELTGAAERGPLAILAGNPHARGRRFIVLAFRAGEPAVVAKIGLDAEARFLIDREATFLQAQAAAQPHLPTPLGGRSTPRWQGLALVHVAGEPPRADAYTGMREVLSAWIDPARTVPLETLAPWRRLLMIPGMVSSRLAGATVAPVLFHGDFAPWNVRVARDAGRWTVLDWERGAAAGVPGWDWFHWLIHVSVLVRREATADSMNFLSEALRQPNFRAYAQAAQIAGLEQALLSSYVIYLHEFIVPPEIKTIIARLRDATAGWL
jgi:hypothetical protein